MKKKKLQYVFDGRETPNQYWKESEVVGCTHIGTRARSRHRQLDRRVWHKELSIWRDRLVVASHGCPWCQLLRVNPKTNVNDALLLDELSSPPLAPGLYSTPTPPGAPALSHSATPTKGTNSLVGDEWHEQRSKSA